MPRYGTKTYGRKAKDSEADQEFDELFGDARKGNNLPSKTASTHRRWGNMAYTSSRVTRKSAMQAKEPEIPPVEPPRKRRRNSDDSSGDPFSFDSDDDKGSPRKRALQTPPTKTNQIVESPKKKGVIADNKSSAVTNTKQTKEDVENTRRSPVEASVKSSNKDHVAKSKQGSATNKGELSSKLPIKPNDSRPKVNPKSSESAKPAKAEEKTVKSKTSDNTIKTSKIHVKPMKPASVPTSGPNDKNLEVKHKVTTDIQRAKKIPGNVDGIRTQEEHAYAQKSPPRDKSRIFMSQMEEEHAYAQKPLPNKMEEEHAYAQRFSTEKSDLLKKSRTNVSKDNTVTNTFAKRTNNNEITVRQPVKTYGSKLAAKTAQTKASVSSAAVNHKPGMIRTSSAPIISSTKDSEANDDRSGKDGYDFDDDDDANDDDFLGSSKRIKVVRTYSRHSNLLTTSSGRAGIQKPMLSQASSRGATLSSSSTTSQQLDAFAFDDSDHGKSENDEGMTFTVKDQQLSRKVRSARLLTGKSDLHPSSSSSTARSSSPVTKSILTTKDSPGKKGSYKATYNARPWQKDTPVTEIALPLDDDILSELSEPGPSTSRPSLVRAVTYPTRLYQDTVTSLKCNRQEKPLYTVVKHVKQAHQCQESGESQEFIDDVEYLLDGLNDTETMSTRCLSAVSLASKCSVSSFRMHLRAHGMVSKIFTALHDAASNPSLALCTAALLFMLSKDRLNMDLDKKSLALLVKLMDADPKASPSKLSKEYNRTKEKVRSIFQKLPGGMVKTLDLNSITTNYLAMEALLSLTSKKAGEWFKEELRLVGGLDHIVHSVCKAVESLSGVKDTLSDRMVDTLKKIERCLQVLENVTFMNAENQSYLITFENFVLVSSVTRILRVCEKFVQIYPEDEEVDPEDASNSREPGPAVRHCMLAVLRVLLNLAHDNEWGSTKMGEKEGLISTALCCVLQAPQYVPPSQRFDILVLSLGLLINLVEHSAKNRKSLVATKTHFSYDSQSEDEDGSTEAEVSSIEALVQLFLQRQKAAKDAESQNDAFNDPEQLNDKSGEWIESEEGLEWVVIPEKGEKDLQESEEQIKKSITKALHKAGKHMEDSIVASYVALLVGCLIQDSRQTLTKVKQVLPNGDFAGMVEMLNKFLDFMNMTTAAGTKGSKSISRVIEVLEAS
ncbi:wings apart-like protein homolog [Ptychodera flava]|uniref:wings apart-like protein homolog n=1 Tax=Ptychodera flava TaxID=63121 RepID=UPI00396A0D3C